MNNSQQKIEKFFNELISMHHSNKTGFCRHYMFLYSVILGMEAKNVFEFGSGYSSKTILWALMQTEGYLTSCDYRSIDQSCMNYFTDVEEFDMLAKRWKYINKRSSHITPDIIGKAYDVVLHDGSHTKDDVINDLKFIIPLMKKGSILMVHDTAHPTGNYQLDDAVKEVSGLCSGTHATEQITIPYGYGLTMVRILEDFGNGEVKIKWRKE